MIIRKLRSTDAEQIALLMNNKKIWDNIRDFVPFPYTQEDGDDFIALCLKEDPVRTFAIEVDGILVGVIGLILQQDIYRKTAELGYWIGEPYWNKGYASKAISLIVEYGFNELHLMRIFSGVFDYNKASQRVLEKAGFTFEGIFEKAIIKNEKIIDEYRYAIINKL
jgi:RimJ/RimL family protein N-acetyltransferase